MIENEPDKTKCKILQAFPALRKYYLTRFVHTYTYKSSPYGPDAILSYREKLDDRFLKHLNTYKPPPKTDEKFDVVKDFQRTFTKNIEKYIRMDTRREMANKEYRNVPLSQMKEDEVDQAYYEESLRKGSESMEDRLAKEMMQERMEKLNKEFTRYLNTTEKIVFRGMLDEQTVGEAIASVGPTQSGELLTPDKLRHLRNLIQFRIVCWYGFHHFLDEDVVLKGLNKFPNFCSRFWGMRKLESGLDGRLHIGIMEAVAKGVMANPPKFHHDKPKRTYEEIKIRVKETMKEVRENRGYNGEWAFCCPWYKGEKHDHPVVFVNLSGWAYSHVDKSKWDIFAA